MGICIFNVLRNCQTVLQTNCTTFYTINNVTDPFASHPNIWCCQSFLFSPSVIITVKSICVLDSISFLFSHPYHRLFLRLSGSSHSIDFWSPKESFSVQILFQIIPLTLSFLWSNWQEKWLAFRAYPWWCSFSIPLELLSGTSAMNLEGSLTYHCSWCLWGRLWHYWPPPTAFEALYFIAITRFSLLFQTSTLLPPSF